MIDRRATWTLPLLVLATVGCALALSRIDPATTTEPPARGPSAAPALRPSGSSTAPVVGALRWIVAGGGPTPDLNQVQIEQDLLLAREVLGPLGPGLTLFAGGPRSRAVQVLDPDPPTDPLLAELAALLAPRPGREASYRSTSLAADGAATAEAILAALEGALPDGDAPLTVYVAGHGLGGEQPSASRVLTWGPGDLWVEDVAAVLDDTPGHRPLRLVVTACFSGGFAELAFAAADPEQGAAATDRCGLFATTWDRTASGCDPNPDRGAQEGYGMHFLQALRGLGRDGQPLRPDRLDLDGDGVVSLLEAHTRARIESRSLDVPITTSSRFLRAVVDPSTEHRSAVGHDPEACRLRRRVGNDRAECGVLPTNPDAPTPERAPTPPLPEERAVIDALTARLALSRPEQAFERLATETAELERLAAELDELEEQLAEAEEILVAALLHRWPLLDDPWHPRFASALEVEREAITAFLAEAGEAGQHRDLVEARDRLAEEHDRRLVAAAPLERLVDALETVELATRLFAVGGRHWLRFQALLTCERGHP